MLKEQICPLCPSKMHAHFIHSIYTSHHTPHTTLISSTLYALDTTPEPHVPPIYSPQPHLSRPPYQHFRHPRTLSAYSAHTQTTVHASQLTQLPYPEHMVPRQPHRQTKDEHMTTTSTRIHH